MKKLFLLDAYALIYRAHYSLVSRPLINSKGVNTSAIFGFVGTLLDVLQKEQPTHVGVAFDLDTPTFRHELFADYKANREEQPEDIAIAVPQIKRLLPLLGITGVELEGYEADDVVGTLALQAAADGFEVYMMTPDKDYGQLLISDQIKLYKPARFGNAIEIMGTQEVLDKWSIERISQVVDMLALQGDAVDNIPGVRGIGEKTAQSLLKTYGSVDGIYANIDKLPERQRKMLLDGKENALLSYRLATIATDAPIKFQAEQFAIRPIERTGIVQALDELEFRSLTERVLKYGRKFEAASESNDSSSKPSKKSAKAQAAADSGQVDLFGEPVENTATEDSGAPHRIAKKNLANSPHQYHCLQSSDEIRQLVDRLCQAPYFAFDTETTGLDLQQCELVGLSFALKAEEAFFIPLPVDKSQALATLELLRPALEKRGTPKIAQNAKFDLQVLSRYGIQVAPPIEDTMLIHYVLEPERRHNMDYMSETYLDYAPVAIETLIGSKGKRQLTMRDVPLAKLTDYAAEDADITLRLFEHLRPQLTEQRLSLYTDIELPLIPVLADMEQAGVKIDADFLQEYTKILAAELQQLEQKIYAQAGTKFNLNSPAQVGEILFDRLKIPYRWKLTSKNKQYSTDEEKLSELAEEHKIIAEILEYRQVAKLQSTYAEALPTLISPATGMVHSSFNQALTATGRLSSQNPNLQNIPIRSERGREIRKAFVARSAERSILAADYSQIELRLVAAMSRDATMLGAFQQGLDIHTATAASIYGVPLAEVTKQQRYAAKTVNFSIIYGAGATNLSRQLDISRKDAATLIEQYFTQYPTLKAYMEGIIENARKSGYVTTLCGRRRYLRDLHSSSSLMRSHAERNAVNTPIQGTAADMIKIAMVRIHEQIRLNNLRSQLVLQVHDELVFDAFNEEIPQLTQIIRHCMQNALPSLDVPIEVGIGIGSNWLEAH